MVARILILAFAATLLIPGARADDERRVLYLHSDGSLRADPATGPVGGSSFSADPASGAYVLRAGVVFEVPTSIVGQRGVEAQLRLNGSQIGSVSVPARLVNLGASTAVAIFDNPDTFVAKGAVLSVHLEGAAEATSLLGGILREGAGSTSAPRLVLRAGAPPPPDIAPTPPSPAPPATAPPVTNTTTVIYVTPTPAASTPTNGAAGDDANDPGEVNRAALRTTFANAMPNVPPTTMLMLMLLATASIGLVTLLRLGRR